MADTEVESDRSVPALTSTNGDARAATGELCRRLFLSEPDDADVDNVLTIVFFRKLAHELLASLGDDALPADALAAKELFEKFVAEVPAASILFVFANRWERLQLDLGYACVTVDEERLLVDLTRLAGNSTADRDEINRTLDALQGALNAADVDDAVDDPAFLLQLIILAGPDQSGATPDIGLSPEMMFDAMRRGADVERLAALVALLKARGSKPACAIFELWLFAAQLAHRSASGAAFQQQDADDLRAVLDRLVAAESTHLAAQSRVSLAVLSVKTDTVAAFALLPTVHDQDKQYFQSLALDCYQLIHDRAGAEEAMFGPLLVSEARLIWGAAQSGQENRAERRRAAISRLNALLSTATLQPEPMNRLITMAQLAGLLATAYYETGQFPAAIDKAAMSQHFAQSLESKMKALLSEDGTLFGAATEFMTSSLTAISTQADRALVVARARLAENRAEFGEASILYAQAANLENTLRRRSEGLMTAFLGTTRAVGSRRAELESDARAAHLAGIAQINEADAALFSGEFKTAQQRYDSAQKSLHKATELWEEVRSLMPDAATHEAVQQGQVSALRARYCDCKTSLARAEQLAFIGSHLKAAQTFMTAKTVLQELVERSLDVDEPGNQQILIASQFYAEARSLFEIDLDQSSDGNLRKARAGMSASAARFEGVGQTRLSAHIRAQADELEAHVLKGRLDSAPDAMARQTLMARVSDRLEDAGNGYAQIGLERPAERSANAQSPPTIVLANPHVLIGASTASAQSPLDPEAEKEAAIRAIKATIDDLKAQSARSEIEPGRLSSLILPFYERLFQLKPESQEMGVKVIDQKKLIQIRAKALALEKQIAEQKDMLERGILDPGRYAALSTDYNRQRFALLLDLQTEVSGVDPGIDDILADAVDGTVDHHELTQKIEKIAEEKGMGAQIGEAINKNRGTIVTWAIDLAIAIGKRVV